VNNTGTIKVSIMK